MEYKTTEDRVRYVLERQPELAESDRSLTLAVWHAFYPDKFGLEGMLSPLSALDLPSVQQVRAALRRISKTDEDEEPPEPEPQRYWEPEERVWPDEQ